MRKFRISGVKFGDIAFLNHPLLEDLCLDEANLHLSDDLTSLKNLRRLNLYGGVKLDDENFERLCRLIESSATLQEIKMRVHDSRSKRLCLAMTRSASLGYVYLNFNGLSDLTGESIASLISGTWSIFDVYLVGLKFPSSDAIGAILSALHFNETLSSFCLHGHFESLLHASTITPILRENLHLISFDIRNTNDNFSYCKGNADLEKAIESNNRLTTFPGILPDNDFFYPVLWKNVDIADRAKIEMHWILFFGRIFTGSRFKSNARFLPFEIREIILYNLSAGGFLIPQRRSLIIRTVLDRRTVGRLRSSVFTFTLGSLEYLCKQANK
jgi:hypothetical protein